MADAFRTARRCGSSSARLILFFYGVHVLGILNPLAPTKEINASQAMLAGPFFVFG
jgi:hypothetical protein